jgi:hypothetical protein
MDLFRDTYETAWAVYHLVRLGDRWDPNKIRSGIASYIWEYAGYKQWPGWTTICEQVGLEDYVDEFWALENETLMTKEQALARYAELITIAHGRGMKLL